MVKVVGTSAQRQEYCNNCGKLLEFTLAEVRAGGPIPGDDEGEHTSIIICPNCRCAVDVTSLVGPTSAEKAHRQYWEELTRDYD